MHSATSAEIPELVTPAIQHMQDIESSNQCEKKDKHCKGGDRESCQSEIFHSLDMLQRAICEFEENTQSNFIIHQKSKEFGKEDFKPNARSRIQWKSNDIQYGKLIKFSGIPYVVVGRKTLQCHLGRDFSIVKKKNYGDQRQITQGEDHTFTKRRRIIQHTKKMGCPAEINVLHIIRYPDFMIQSDTQKRRRNASKKVKEAFQSDTIQGNHAYVIRFPHLSEHKFHATSGELANLQEKVDRRVQEKVISLHRNGVRKINEMMRHINAFVTQELFPGDDPPVALRRRFYPTRKDLANLMFKAKQEGRNSSLDQENVLNQLKEWKEQIPQLNIFCRPNTTSEEMTNKQSFILCYQAE
ncbi:calcium-responsive transcription factor-like [Mixophyes fleayi]|uniref:calcium-responsive transcription factor-like n=1 Tax=Mixophyes fleayi TaxID=3061075 RepID=UPI003F4E2F25